MVKVILVQIKDGSMRIQLIWIWRSLKSLETVSLKMLIRKLRLVEDPSGTLSTEESTFLKPLEIPEKRMDLPNFSVESSTSTSDVDVELL